MSERNGSGRRRFWPRCRCRRAGTSGHLRASLAARARTPPRRRGRSRPPRGQGGPDHRACARTVAAPPLHPFVPTRSRTRVTADLDRRPPPAGARWLATCQLSSPPRPRRSPTSPRSDQASQRSMSSPSRRSSTAGPSGRGGPMIAAGCSALTTPNASRQLRHSSPSAVGCEQPSHTSGCRRSVGAMLRHPRNVTFRPVGRRVAAVRRHGENSASPAPEDLRVTAARAPS